jgi:hypothetical protein
VNVTAADSTGRDADEHFVRLRLRIGHIDVSQFRRGGEQEGFHGAVGERRREKGEGRNGSRGQGAGGREGRGKRVDPEGRRRIRALED